MHLSFLKHYRETHWMIWVKVIMVLIPVVLFVSLLNGHVFLTKTLSYTYTPGSKTATIRPKNGTQLVRTGDPLVKWQITPDSFPFNVTLPRQTESVRVTATLARGTQSTINLRAAGVKGNDLTTIAASKFLDDLDWPHITDGNRTIWQQRKTYTSVEAFLAKPPDLSSVATVGLDHMTFAGTQTIDRRTTPLVLPNTFRGSHQFYTYVHDSTYTVSLDKMDLNKGEGADGLTLRIARADTLTSDNRHWLKSVSIGDDGNVGKNGPSGKPQHLELVVTGLTEGIYLVDIFATGDTTFTNLSSSESGLSFNGHVLLAEGPAFGQKDFSPVQVVATSSTLTFAVQHDQGKQTITVNGKKTVMNDVKVNHQFSKLSGSSVFTIQKGDILLSGDGIFTLAPASPLHGVTKDLDLSGTPKLDGIDYIIAHYVPKKSGSTITVSHQYPVRDLAMAGKTLTFFIDAPGMQSAGATLGLKSLHVTMTRGAIPWDKIWTKLHLKK